MLNRELKNINDICEHVENILTRCKEVKYSDKRVIASMYFAYIKGEAIDDIKDIVASKLSKSQKVEELFFDNKYALCSMELKTSVDSHTYYFVVEVSTLIKLHDLTVSNTKEEAMIMFLAEKSGNKNMANAILKLLDYELD